MSSTVIITAGTLASMGSAGAGTAASLGVAGLGLGPVGLGLIAGAALIAFLSSSSSSAGKNKVSSSVAVSSEETKRAVNDAWTQTKKELITEAAGIVSTYERERVIASIGESEAQYKTALANGDASSAGHIVNSLREKMFSLHADELILKDKQNNLLRMLCEMKAKAPEGYLPELEVLSKDIPADNLSLGEQSRRLNTLAERLSSVMHTISAASQISLDGLVEDRVFLPPVHKESSPNTSELQNAKLLEDICDFGTRLSFFGQDEADKFRDLILEAKDGAGTFRLKAIRDQIKTTYGYLRERAALTGMFRQDCQEFLEAMRNAAGTENLCARIEALLQSEYISREEYNEVYKSVRTVFQAQAGKIIETLFISTVEAELEDMGYQLLDEKGNPVKLAQGKIHTLDTPYDGYKLRVKVGEDHTVATRLVRAVGSEAEKSSVSEYQKQKDTETGRKLCSDLNRIYATLRKDGLMINEVMRKEPGQETVDVVIDKSIASRKRKRKASEKSKPQQRVRHL